MKVQVVTSLAQVGADQWNALAGPHPFLRHEFLYALETSGCVGGTTGWTPRHVLIHEQGTLVAAAPAYLKRHSYGEYVFDWAWAQAYARNGLEYYPKLVLAVPFSPVTGPRLLIAPAADTGPLAEALLARCEQQAEAEEASSAHCLFPDPSTLPLLLARGWLRRDSYQFHWHNQGYADFDAFLGAMTAHKRKKIRHERRAVAAAGVHIELVEGAHATAEQWEAVYACYAATIEKHGAIAYLNPHFFEDLGRTLGQRVLLVLAERDGRYIAAALNLLGNDVLYGRYWGQLDPVEYLHFEACYYAPIEWCIRRGIARFEAGAQGEHKLSRGLMPSPTYSAHWIRDTRFRSAIADFLERERHGLTHYMDDLCAHGPFRQPDLELP